MATNRQVLFLRNHSYCSPDFALLLTTVKTLRITQITQGSLLLSMILINKLVNWSSVPNRLDSTEWGGVCTIASSPERDQCQNLCSLPSCFVLWNNTALISPMGAGASISLTGKKWRLHFLPRPAAELSWPTCAHSCLCADTLLTYFSTRCLEWQLKQWKGSLLGQGGRTSKCHYIPWPWAVMWGLEV